MAKRGNSALYRAIWVPSLAAIFGMILIFSRQQQAIPAPHEMVQFATSDKTISLLRPSNTDSVWGRTTALYSRRAAPGVPRPTVAATGSVGGDWSCNLAIANRLVRCLMICVDCRTNQFSLLRWFWSIEGVRVLRSLTLTYYFKMQSKR